MNIIELNRKEIATVVGGYGADEDAKIDAVVGVGAQFGLVIANIASIVVLACEYVPAPYATIASRVKTAAVLIGIGCLCTSACGVLLFSKHLDFTELLFS